MNSLWIWASSLALVLSAGLASAQDSFGPEFGNNKLSAEIISLTARPDVDDYVADLVEGESISVSVAAAKGSGLRLSVTVLDPDGVDRTDLGRVRSKKGGAKVSVTGIAADRAGRWTVRIEGVDGTEGAYTAKFKLGAPGKLKAVKQRLGGDDPAVRSHVFGAVSGALLDVTVKGSKKGAPVVVQDLRGPLGQVSGLFGEDDTALVVKGTATKLKKHRLDAGTGEYALDVGSTGAGEYKVILRVTPPPRPGGKASISSVNDPHLDDHGAPVRSAAGQPVRITGRNFALSPFPSVRFGPFVAAVVGVGPARNTIDVIVPPGEDGSTQDVTVVNPDGQAAHAADFIVYVSEAVIERATIVTGPVLRANEVRREGGAVIEVVGRNFLPADTVTLNDVVVARSDATATGFRVTLPAGAAGPVTLRLTDEFGRVQTVQNVAHRVGFEDATLARLPRRSFVDDLSAFDAAIGDLDRDGRVDDLVIVTYNRHSRLYPTYVPSPYYVYGVKQPDNPLGTRTEYTRVFTTDNQGRLVDRTAAFVPRAGSDARGVEDWNALSVALGDIDGRNGPDIVLGGSRGKNDTAKQFPTVRVLLNNGAGNFTFAPTLSPPPLAAESTFAVDQTYVPPDPNDPEPEVTGVHPVTGRRTAPGVTAALAIGDLDGDLDPDVVTGAPGFGYAYVFIDPSRVDFTRNPPYVHTSNIVRVDQGYYFSGTRIYENQGGTRLADASEARLPFVGTKSVRGLPAFPARDLALGDLDGDSDLDLVLTFNNPAAVIPQSAATNHGGYAPYSYGRYEYFFNASRAIRTVATRVLLNTGAGDFTDATSTWLPAASGDEFWQAHRLLFQDLDGDGDRDLVLLHRRALNAHRFNPSDTPTAPARGSLRILRNDGAAAGFTDVTATALPAALAGFRGMAIAAGDIDQDGRVELVVGTREALVDGQGRALPSTRILWGGDGLVFTLRDEFVPGTSVDTGEVTGLLFGDLDRDGLLELLMLGEDAPRTSTGGELLRMFEWQR